MPSTPRAGLEAEASVAALPTQPPGTPLGRRNPQLHFPQVAGGELRPSLLTRLRQGDARAPGTPDGAPSGAAGGMVGRRAGLAPHETPTPASARDKRLPATPNSVTLRGSFAGPASAVPGSAPRLVTAPGTLLGGTEGQKAETRAKSSRQPPAISVRQTTTSLLRILGEANAARNVSPARASSSHTTKAASSQELSTPPGVQPTKEAAQPKKKKKKKKGQKHAKMLPKTQLMDQPGRETTETASASATQEAVLSTPTTTSNDSKMTFDTPLPSMHVPFHGGSFGGKAVLIVPSSSSSSSSGYDVARSSAIAAAKPNTSKKRRGHPTTFKMNGAKGLVGVPSVPAPTHAPGDSTTGASVNNRGQSCGTAAAASLKGTFHFPRSSLESPTVAPRGAAATVAFSEPSALHSSATESGGGASDSPALAQAPTSLHRAADSAPSNGGGTTSRKAATADNAVDDPKKGMKAGAPQHSSIPGAREGTASPQQQQPPNLLAAGTHSPSDPPPSLVAVKNTPLNVTSTDEKRSGIHGPGSRTSETAQEKGKKANSFSPQPILTSGRSEGEVDKMPPRSLLSSLAPEPALDSHRGEVWSTEAFPAALMSNYATPWHNGRADASDVSHAAPSLSQYIHMAEADLSGTTLSVIGPHLSMSRTLRVINLKACTTDEEGLRGLAEIRTLQVLCVSHMRHLHSLRPLIQRCNGLFAGIEEIDAQCTPLQNAGIAGVEWMQRLRRLCLSMTRVTDVTSLSASRSLEELIMTGTPLRGEGILGLEKIPTLRTLDLSRTKVQALRELYRSRSLENLILYSCKVTNEDVRLLAQMPRLKTLDVSTTKVRDLSRLSESPSLKRLTAQWLSLLNCRGAIAPQHSFRNEEAHASPSLENKDFCRKDSWSPACLHGRFNDIDTEAGFRGLASIPTLEHVDLSYCAIQSVKSLFHSKSIKELILRRTLVDNDGIEGIQNMRSLQKLVINNTTGTFYVDEGFLLSSVTGVLVLVTELSNALNLVVLDLSFTDVYDLRMLAALPHLQELYLVETLVTVDGIRGVERIPTLRILDLSQTSVASLQFLSAGCKKLKQLFLRSNRNVRGFCIGNLHALPSLELLDVSDTVVEDIRMLFHPTYCLKHLIWRWGERRDVRGPIEPLPPWVKTPVLDGIELMPRLEVVDITNADVRAVGFLSKARSLRRLNLSRCRALSNGGILGLECIGTLEELDLSHVSGITDVSCLASSPMLRELRLGWTGVTLEGLRGVRAMPTLKLLDLTATPAEAAAGRKGGGCVALACGLDNYSPWGARLPDAATQLTEASAPPVLLQKCRARRVSFLV
ncbi:uncharacterized protein Tco025E_00277 [Trypanosoma conorhini]|uniref:Zer-1-like leucine-rich repeats region domain-containing protein n=1 Tax=Trypanosoma conorhini TaxID=83891 RepID=A0A422QC24_9TRYP|nr:uncharacterized protein Tco025E_00277 [Trypanosoma conorhini]RNF27475.1 hypothetical protein Tco025E_00277 [Trypanosoma conorhini]